MTDLTPMMRQYSKIKQDHNDSILFFRLGDFYEMFGPDAELASKELEITLTGRGCEEKRVPMCGVPYHAADSYISKLITKGYKVAVCEQVEDPASAKGIVRREVIKIITPGTIIDTGILPAKKNNYLISIALAKKNCGIAYVDVSTGEFKAAEIGCIKNFDVLFSEISRISPSECLLFIDMIDAETDLCDFLKNKKIMITPYKFKDAIDANLAEEKLCSYFKISSLASFGMDGFKMSFCASSSLIEYLKETQKTVLSQMTSIVPYQVSNFMFIDSITRRNLELVATVRDDSLEGSLLSVLDKTKTGMGGRLLRSWILQPLLEKDLIEKRLDAVEELSSSTMLREELGSDLERIYDIERLTAKIASNKANARDMVALSDSLKILPEISKILKNSRSELLLNIFKIFDTSSMVSLIDSSIMDDPPFIITEGGIIKHGYNKELDNILDSASASKEWIAKFESAEKIRTGIKSLKVGFTKVFGYYIDVTASNLKYVPDNYIRKQTLVNCERYITPELKEKESMILNSDDIAKKMEYSIFCEIRSNIANYTKELKEIASVISQIDVLMSLAQSASKNKYCRPDICTDSLIEISHGRHPVVESMDKGYKFVPNDSKLDKENSFMIITGPNMGGKSTYMRQIALIVLMAQIGSFVPAQNAKISLVDRIFTRIGAMDDLSCGQSTFMVEMTEVSNILNNATVNSLIILDEIGRGTSTFDGMSIAYAVAEYIHNKIRAKTLFATHYHELTQLSNKYSGMANYSAAVAEEGEHVSFLYKILPGPADKSYGIHVAKFAGLPNEVIERAKEVYSTLENVEDEAQL